MLQSYLEEIRRNRGSGAATDETSFYTPLENLLDAVGEDLEPPIDCVMQLKDAGAGNPDGGLFRMDQIPETRAPLFDDGGDVPKPERGAIEVKAPAEGLDDLQESDQVEKYLEEYGICLITNYRAFRLLGADGPTGPDVLEDFELAESEEAFWELTHQAGSIPSGLEERFEGFLKRVLTRNAPLRQPEDVAALLASYARDARLRLEDASLEDLGLLRDSFEESLGVEFQGNQGEEFFRSTIIQTLFYGLFSAWVLWHREAPDREDEFDWHEATDYLGVPVLERLFNQVVVPSQLRQFRLLEILSWTEDALNRVDREAFFDRFEEKRAVQYFYEPFLERFDSELREQLGVWYTPEEVVEYQVRRVDTVLREKLGIRDGLASEEVVVLDPCCGTGAYLVEVLRQIARRLKEQGQEALMAEVLREAATNRIYGFEVLTAPFVVAHLQIGLFLDQIGAPLIDAEDERAGVYLTNALTGWRPDGEEEKRTFPEFKAERLAAEEVKQEEQILVVLGNPPYSGYAGIAVGEERELSEAYRETEEAPDPQGHGLNDLYVRFFRMAERQIVENTEKGVVSYISNYSWLDGLSHTGMREQYLDVFDEVWIDNMNGDKYRTGKRTPQGDPDPSVFSTDYSRIGIQVGTAVSLLCRDGEGENAEEAEVHYREFWGTEKRRELLATADLTGAEGYKPLSPPLEIGLPFAPRESNEGYFGWPKVPEIFPISHSGVQTRRDNLVVGYSEEELRSRMEKYFNPSISHEEIAEICPRAMKETAQFNPIEAREYLVERGMYGGNVVKYTYRPLDQRWVYWEPEAGLHGRPVPDLFAQVFNGNHFLYTTGQTRKREVEPPLYTRALTDLNCLDSGARGTPMYIDPEENGDDLFSQPIAEGSDSKTTPNLTDGAVEYLNGLSGTVETLFYHSLAVLHAPTYRQENKGALRQDWPRVPLPEDEDVLKQSAELGREVASLLDVEQEVEGITAGTIRPELRPIGVPTSASDKDRLSREDFGVTAGWGYTAHHGATMPAGGEYEQRSLTPEEETALPEGAAERLGGSTYDIYLNDSAYWQHVPERVWDYTLGGYPVIKKWLSYREKDVLGRQLKLDEVQHVTSMIRRIAALLLLEPRLNDNYERVKGSTQ
ncbi:type ISP restriction/modification enzyme [Salinibacter ruber]|uniref:type ISP restriction/modification enzyme n=1 Tax=Salinibacter ruber TaxID=146919 RepID=UPI0021672057|nr:type ISP restriction/modification enzyme [Salinibacter ruber]MCS3698577.1 hypothetical protein [Salinibacter ruber]